MVNVGPVPEVGECIMGLEITSVSVCERLKVAMIPGQRYMRSSQELLPSSHGVLSLMRVQQFGGQ